VSYNRYMKNIYTVAEVVKMTGEDKKLIEAIGEYILNIKVNNQYFFTDYKIRKLKNILKYARGGEIIHEL
jgi:hypothetical protein